MAEERVEFKSGEAVDRGELAELLNRRFMFSCFNSLKGKSDIYLYDLKDLVKLFITRIKEEENISTFKVAELADIPSRSLYYYLDGKRPIPIRDFFVLMDLAKLNLFNTIALFEHSFLKISCGSGSRNRIVKVPLKVDPDLLYVIGYLFGDGCLHSKKWIISFVDEYREHILQVNEIFSKLFSANGKIIESQGKTEVKIYSKALILIFNKVFEMPRGKKKGKLCLPKIWQSLSRAHKLAFLQGLFDADAGLCRIETYEKIPEWAIKKPSIEFVQSDRKLVSQMKTLCEYFGIRASGPYFNKRNGGYRLINGKKPLEKCEVLPLFRHPVKKMRLSLLLNALKSSTRESNPESPPNRPP